jgi:hypothetical protein
MTVSKSAWRVIAVTLAVALFYAATRVDLYDASTPYGMSHKLLGARAPNLPHPWWFSLHILLRKVYSVIAFASIGFSAEKALNPTPTPKLRATVLVALYSLGIEFAQHAIDPSEPIMERVLDVACGALGGWIGASAIASIERRRRAPGQPSRVAPEIQHERNPRLARGNLDREEISTE